MKLPLYANPDFPGTIRDANGDAIAITSALDYDETCLIIRAVNSHDALLAAAKLTVEAADDENSASGDIFGGIRQLKAAIAAAERPAS